MIEREMTDLKERELRAKMCIIKFSQNNLQRTNNQVFDRYFLELRKGLCVRNNGITMY